MISLNYVKESRGLSFVRRGMKVEHTYNGVTRVGVIKSGNSGGNLNILFEGDKKVSNCHPTWAIKYFNDDGKVIAEYGE